jgi:hypothetical protein
MKTMIHAALIAALAGLAGAGAARAAGPVETKLYFHCANSQNAPTPLKVQNLGTVTGYPSWNGTAPTTSYTAGGGCGTADPGPAEGTAPRNLYDGVFAGTHGGAIDKMRFELHSLVLSQARNTPQSTLRVKIRFGAANDTFAAAPAVAERTVSVTPEKSATGATEVFKFTLDELEIPADAASRVISLTIATDLTYANAWVFDATEIASSVTFVAPPTP